jgi:uncharacterized membrane protein YcaP (DUF421 family)
MHPETEFYRVLDGLLGLDLPPASLGWAQVGVRCIVVFVFGVILVRLADRRFLGRNASFDVLLGIVLGSVLSRAINGQAPFFKTLAAAALLVLLHRLVGALTCRWPWFSRLIKGDAVVLIRQGAADPRAMRACDISEDDLEENLRLNGNVNRRADVEEARLERNGQIGVVRKRSGE